MQDPFAPFAIISCIPDGVGYKIQYNLQHNIWIGAHSSNNKILVAKCFNSIAIIPLSQNKLKSNRKESIQFYIKIK